MACGPRPPAVQPATHTSSHYVPTRPIPTTTSSVGVSDKADDPHENWCGICFVKFGSKASLQAHIKQSPAKHQHYCNLCKRVFKDQNGIKNHVENSKGHEVSCNVCFSAFIDKWALKCHFDTHPSGGHQFACFTCLLGFRSQGQLEWHLRSAPAHIHCGPCDRWFHTNKQRDDHWKMTKLHRHCLLPGCTFDARDEVELDGHLERDHYQCKICKDIMPSQTRLTAHEKACENVSRLCTQSVQLNELLTLSKCLPPQTSSGFICWGCSLPANTISALLAHLESGRCSELRESSLIMHCLGKWWYSPLFMCVEMHAQLRTDRLSLQELRQLQEWMEEGAFLPFICRNEGCMKMFSHLSEVAKHWEAGECEWGLSRLNVEGLKEELKNVFAMRHLCPE
ncbi:hypothetical protein IQ07DRAFT_500119 [Pyrenochaeta sp. DS3sAY3a]|nr:hypothetical protein IQ07DRAFT_500119 [Pyrenochaeta sp. DS3sAY3a]